MEDDDERLASAVAGLLGGATGFMRITDFLSLEAVIFELSARSKTDVLKSLALGFANALPAISSDRFFEVLHEREKLVSTGMEKGIAIPHGRLSEVPTLTACLAISHAGTAFEALDGKPTHFFFALVAPEASAGMHLKALSKINRLFRSDALKAALLAAPNREEVYRLVREEDIKS
jgi:nitrogen PTS system EIIA component